MKEKAPIKARKGFSFKHILMRLTYALKYFEHQLIFWLKAVILLIASKNLRLREHPCGANVGLCCALNLGVEISA